MKLRTIEHVVRDIILLSIIAFAVVATRFLYDLLLETFHVVDAHNAISIVVAVLITFLVYKSYNKKILSLLNKTIFKNYHVRRIEFAHLNEDIMGELDIETLAHKIIEKLVVSFQVSHAAVFVYNQFRDQYRIIDQYGLEMAHSEYEVDADESIIQGLRRKRRHILYKSSYHFLPWNEAVSVDSFFEKYSAKIVFPFFYKDSLVAFLTIDTFNNIGTIGRDITDFYYALSKYAGAAFYTALKHRAIIAERTETSDAQGETVQRLKVEAIDTLATGIAHEIRNPLTIISLKAQSMLKKIKGNTAHTDEIVHTLSSILEQIARTTEITRRLITFSRKELEETEIHVKELVDELHEVLSYAGSFDDIKFLKFIDPSIPNFKASYSEMRELLLNVLINAKEAVKEGGMICLYAQYKSVDKCICIHVVDNGTQLSKDVTFNESGVFDPFFTLKDGKANAGLGLYICQQIVHRYNGVIQFRRNQPVGCEVIIELPVNNRITTFPAVSASSEEQSMFMDDTGDMFISSEKMRHMIFDSRQEAKESLQKDI